MLPGAVTGRGPVMRRGPVAVVGRGLAAVMCRDPEAVHPVGSPPGHVEVSRGEEHWQDQ